MKNNIGKFLISLMIPILLMGADVIDRDGNVSHDIALGSKPSNLPTGGLIHDFKPIKKNLFLDADLSVNPDARIFAGYGVYDKKDNNCMYIDLPTSDGSLADSKFQYFKVYNGHSYAVSIDDMTYGECQAESLKYHGYPAEITTREEDSALKMLFKDNEYWIDVQRGGPCPSTYVSHEGKQLRYNGFIPGEDYCENSTPYTTVKSSYWTQKDLTYQAKCMIEIDTENWKKPIKSCAPWWGIERTYPIEESSKYKVTVKNGAGEYVEIDIRDFNQKDFPKSLKMCTKVNAIAPETISLGNQTVMCNSYYDRTASPRCLETPEQSLCKVDECRGAIKNRCQLIDSGDAPLDYSKEPAFIDGQFRYIKKRTKIKIHKYSCPITKEGGDCLEVKTIRMLPKPCPGTEVDSNGTEVRPIRVYGSSAFDGPNKYDADGNLQNLYGKCPDGTMVEVPINVMEQNNRICTEYETVEYTKEWDEMCQVDKSSNDYVVEAAINAPDAYRHDPDCIRINNIEDARPRQDIRIDYETFGFASLAIVKAQIDGKEDFKYESILPSSYYQDVLAGINEFKDSTFSASGNSESFFAGTEIADQLPSYSCDGLGVPGEANPMFVELKSYQENSISKVYDYDVGQILMFGTISNCETIVSDYNAMMLWGGAISNSPNPDIATLDVLYETDYQLTSVTGLTSVDLINHEGDGGLQCVGVRDNPFTLGDVYKKIEINGDGLLDTIDNNLYSTDSVTYERCREIAICTGTNVLNDIRYTGTQQCTLSMSEDSGESAYIDFKADYTAAVDAWIAANTNVDEAKTVLENGLIARSDSGVLSLDEINGYADIYAILEYTEQDFGYLSAYNIRNFKSNFVSVNGMVVQPIVEHSAVIEIPKEDYFWDFTVYRNYEPDGEAVIYGGLAGGAAAVLGAAASGAYAASTITATALIKGGMALGPWGLVAAVVIAAVIALFATPVNLLTFQGHNEAELYNVRGSSYRYVENPYGYESRKLYTKNGKDRVLYSEWEYGISSKMEKSDQNKYFEGLQISKKEWYKELNIDTSAFAFPLHERMILTSDPSKKKWNPWAKRSNQDSSSGTLPTSKYHRRSVNVSYMGATNTATIVVPYIGDYKIKAYNANDELVSNYLVHHTSFITSDTAYGTSMEYSQVKLGENMTISTVISGDACEDDLMVSIGGGVTGAYYALGKTGKYNNYKCALADNDYVNYNKITKLTIRAVDQDDSFVIELPKPLPYPNRVFLTTMGESEDRLYRCYNSKFPECIGFEKQDGE